MSRFVRLRYRVLTGRASETEDEATGCVVPIREEVDAVLPCDLQIGSMIGRRFFGRCTRYVVAIHVERQG
jgi:hypothetical protein